MRTTRLIMLDFLDGLEADRLTLSERERVMLRRSTTSSHFTYGPMSQPLKTVTTPAGFLDKCGSFLVTNCALLRLITQFNVAHNRQPTYFVPPMTKL